MVNLNFRRYELSSGRIILAGKDSQQNDMLIKSSKKSDILLHTVEPGSPFVNLGENSSKDEIKEAAIFCALKSQTWRDKKGDIKVHSFYRRDCSKGFIKKQGSWHVKIILGTIKVKKSEIVKLEKKLENGKAN